MPKITRTTQKIFAINAPSIQVTAFGTAKEDSPTYTKDVATIQNATFLTGWNNSLESDKAPFEEDSNGLYLAITSQLAYLFQQGIPEWDGATTYYENSLCTVIQNGNLVIKRSTIDSNIGNDPTTDNVNWVDFYKTAMFLTKADISYVDSEIAKVSVVYDTGWLDCGANGLYSFDLTNESIANVPVDRISSTVYIKALDTIGTGNNTVKEGDILYLGYANAYGGANISEIGVQLWITADNVLSLKVPSIIETVVGILLPWDKVQLKVVLKGIEE